MKYKFSDLIDVAKVERLNDLFYTATGIPAAVIDPEGAIITCSGWQEICTKFHRVNEGTAQQCVESDTVLANRIGVGQKYTVYKCGNGLVVAASPIVIGGGHVANFVTSQFLFHPPDRDSFLEQAKRFGFDEAGYMEAVGKIPVIDESKLPPFLEYFSEFAALLGEMGLKQLKQLEASAGLRESEQRWASTLSSVGDAVIAADKGGRITFMNTAAEGLTGWTLTEAAAKPVTEVFNIINERTREAVDNPVTKVLQKGIIVGLANDTLLLSRDGREIPIDDSGAPIRDRDGNIMGVVLVFRDITERRRAEEKLLRAKEEWALTFDAVPDMIAIIDAEHRVLRVNSAMARRLGRKAEECVGVHCYEAVHGLSAPPFFCPHSRSLKDGGQHIEEITEDRLGGCFLVSTTPLRVPDDPNIRTVHVARDITERKRAEEALRESQRQMNRAQEIAHLGSWELDLVNNRLSWSDEVYRIFGLQPQEFGATYDAFLEAVHPEDREAVDPAYSSSLREGRDTYEIEHRVVRRSSGEIRIVHEKCEHLRDETGRIIKSIGMVHDITERKLAEQELREARAELERKVAERTAELRRSETYLAEGQRLSHTGSFAFDVASNKYIYLSEECLRIFGVDAQEGLPTREEVSRRIHPEDWDGVKGDFEKSLREKVDTSNEFRIVLPSGAAKHIQVIRHPVLNDAGDVVELLGTVIDMTERKRAEEQRRQSVERFRAIADYTYDWENWIGVDGKLLWVNPAVERITGYSVDECMAMPGFHIPIIAEADRETVARQIREAVQGSSRNDFEFRVRHKDGHLVWVAASWQPIYDSRGARLGHRSSIRDITERKSAEEDLRRSEARLAEAQRLSHTGSWAFDLASGNFVYASEECRRMYEFDAQEGLPTRETTFQLIHPEDRDSVQRGFEKSLREKVDTSNEFRLVLPSGTVKHVQTIRHPVLNAAGDVVQLVGTTIDITERKRAEAEINSLKNYLSNIIDSMPSMLVGMDNNRTVTQWNRQAGAFTGIAAGDAIGKPITDLLPDFVPWIMAMGTDMDEHRPSSMEKVLIEKEGERRFYDLMLYPLLTHAVGGAVLRIEDVTERARTQELMVQTEKMMSIGGLAAGMAHEINNPLGIITQAAQNIERRISLELHANRKASEELGLNLEGIRAYFDKRQISDAIASIRTASSRAAKIVANMLQFSRRADTTVEFTSLAPILDQVLELAATDYDLKKKYDFRSIDIIKDYQDTPQVPIVSVEIAQVILNLIKNAAQAMIANPPDRRPGITLRLRCEGRYAVLEVEDNGPGMAEDIRRRVFEPFFTTKEPGVGTGLGLSVSYMIVTQNHKGLMEVQSTPGRGTHFKVRLPIGDGKHEQVGKSIDCGR